MERRHLACPQSLRCGYVAGKRFVVKGVVRIEAMLDAGRMPAFHYPNRLG